MCMSFYWVSRPCHYYEALFQRAKHSIKCVFKLMAEKPCYQTTGLPFKMKFFDSPWNFPLLKKFPIPGMAVSSPVVAACMVDIGEHLIAHYWYCNECKDSVVSIDEHCIAIVIKLIIWSPGPCSLWEARWRKKVQWARYVLIFFLKLYFI